jgi:hypothetical protein
LAFGTWALIVPFRTIAPAYARPPLITEADIPATVSPVHIRYGDGLELIACEPGRAEVHPGESLPITLYWRCRAAVSRDYSLYVHLSGRGRESLGHLDATPGRGSRPTSLWQPGDIFADTFHVPVTVTAQSPTLCRIEVGFYDLATMENLPAYDPQGQPVGSPAAGQVRLASREPTRHDIAHPTSVNLGDQVKLMGYGPVSGGVRPGDEIFLTLYWRCTATPPVDYTVFVHLLGADGAPVAQADAPPLDGDYPTSVWPPGDILADPHRLQLPADLLPGSYTIILGLYDPATGARLSVLNEAGQPVSDHVLLTTLEVAR